MPTPKKATSGVEDEDWVLRLTGDLTEDQVWMSYKLNCEQHIPDTCKRNCRNNPLCLSGLGENTWYNSDYVSDDEEEEEGMKEVNSYVGLKNLGNTCYMNSLLQLWFHNIPFREAVYSVTAAEPTALKPSVCHLKELFAAMQFGAWSSCDPSPFCTSLCIDVDQQEDAQEFNKLYMDKLENAFASADDVKTRNTIQNIFSGTYSYVTTCWLCRYESERPSAFYELELNVKGCKTVEDSLKVFLKEEELSGENGYFCSNCNRKTSGVTRIRLQTLPPILQLQLLRYKFDNNTFVTKKIHSTIEFPDTLDMSTHLGLDANTLLYKLHAVLMHGGNTAYAGHYYAHINTANGWYLFNDNYVKKEHFLMLSGTKVGKSCDKKLFCGKQEGYRSSTAAYMLVYTREMENKPIKNLKFEECGEDSNPSNYEFKFNKNMSFSEIVEVVGGSSFDSADSSVPMDVENCGSPVKMPCRLALFDHDYYLKRDNTLVKDEGCSRLLPLEKQRRRSLLAHSKSGQNSLEKKCSGKSERKQSTGGSEKGRKVMNGFNQSRTGMGNGNCRKHPKLSETTQVSGQERRHTAVRKENSVASSKRNRTQSTDLCLNSREQKGGTTQLKIRRTKSVESKSGTNSEASSDGNFESRKSGRNKVHSLKFLESMSYALDCRAIKDDRISKSQKKTNFDKRLEITNGLNTEKSGNEVKNDETNSTNSSVVNGDVKSVNRKLKRDFVEMKSDVSPGKRDCCLLKSEDGSRKNGNICNSDLPTDGPISYSEMDKRHWAMLPKDLKTALLKSNREFINRNLVNGEIKENPKHWIRKVGEIWANCSTPNIRKGEKFEFVSTEWLKSFLKRKPTRNLAIDNSSLICEHGRLKPEPHLYKAISQEGAEELYVEFGGGPRLDSNKALCAQCVAQSVERKVTAKTLAQDVKIISQAIKSKQKIFGEERLFWVGTKSLRNWRSFYSGGSVEAPGEENSSYRKRKFDSNESDDEDENCFTPNKFNLDVVCRHGNLTICVERRQLVGQSVWIILRKYFPGCREFSATQEMCKNCQEELEELL